MEHRNLALVDDHALIRNGLKRLIEDLGPYQIIAEYDNGKQFVEALQEPYPDLVLLDYSMPQMNGIEVMQWLHDRGLSIPVLMLTINEDERLMIQLFRLGVRGYLHKNCRTEVMKQALEEIFSKGYYHNEFLITALTKDQNNKHEQEQQSIHDQITAKEREFIKWVCHEEEYTYEQIAGIMNVHRRTIDNYKQSLCEKFNIKSKTGLVLFAIKNKLVSLDE